MIKRLLVILALVAAWTIPAPAGPLSASGYFKFFFTRIRQPRLTGVPDGWQIPDLTGFNNRFRFQMSYEPAAWLSLDAAYDFVPRFQNPSLDASESVTLAPSSGAYRVADFRSRIVPAPGDPDPGRWGLYHNLDRLSVHVRLPRADIYVGRQAIAWGSARVINPTDILAPYAFNELDTEYRRGVDAVRVRVPLGALSELDMGYVFGRDFAFRRSAFFIRSRLYARQTDISLLAMGFQGNLLLGLDLARSIGGAGFWLECAGVVDDVFTARDPLGGGNYFRASIGMDYSPSSTTYVFGEYHLNTAGYADPAAYGQAYHSAAYQEGNVYLLGRHYLSGGMTWDITPLLPLKGLVIVNLDDGSVILAPTLEYNLAENYYLGAGAYLGVGRSPGPPRVPGSEPFGFRSEFGTYPDILYLSFKVYF